VSAGVVPGTPAEAPASWIGRLRRLLERELPYEKLLPEEQPAYVASWIYVFGVLTLAALAMIILSGCFLAFSAQGGPARRLRCQLGRSAGSSRAIAFGGVRAGAGTAGGVPLPHARAVP